MSEEPIREAVPVVADSHRTTAPEADTRTGKRRLIPAVLVSASAAVIGAAIWAAITFATTYQIGWMAVGVGLLVELSIRTFGKRDLQGYAAIAAIFALLGCVLGNLFSACGFTALEESANFWQALMHFSPISAIRLMQLSSNSMDILFYGIAACQAYKLSAREHHRIS